MIRSIKHTLKHTNSNKLVELFVFLDHYKIAVQNYIDFIWNNKIESNNKILDIQNNLLEFPLYLDYKIVKFDSKLSARALRSACDQALGIVKSVLAKRSRFLFVKTKLENENKQNSKNYQKLVEKINIQQFSKPIIKNDLSFKAELNSICADFKYQKSGLFQGFIQLKSLGKSFKRIRIPVQFSKADKKWINKNGTLLGGFLISSDKIELRWNIETPEKKKSGKSVGADTGLNTLVTLSDSQFTPETDIHGHSFKSIAEKMNRKKFGSKAFKRAQNHRKNFINWSINQLNLDDIKEIKLEKIDNIFCGRNTSKLLKRWTNADIQRKILLKAEELGVRILLQSCTYRSQRCSRCGIVRKSNRNGKIYICDRCDFIEDADLNGALNNEIELPDIPKWLRLLNLNRSGFLWNPEGFFNLEGQELLVPDA